MTKSIYRPGDPVSGLEELKTLRTVYVLPWRRAHPVAFFLSWPWQVIDSWVQYGRIRRAIKIKPASKGGKKCE